MLAGQVAALNAALEAAGRGGDGVRVINQQTVVVAETDAEAQRLFEGYLEVADAVGALTLMSGWTGIDFSTLAPDSTLEDQDSDAIRSVSRRSRLRPWPQLDDSRDRGVRAARRRRSGDRRLGETVADQLESWVDETGVGGFNLAATAVPESWEQITGLLIPELQRRGRYKKEYASGTLREKLGSSARVSGNHAASKVAL